MKAGADPVGNAFAEVCTNTDRQLHNIPVGVPAGYSFQNYNNASTVIWDVAGGWFAGQNFFRRGRFTKALGTISDIKTEIGSGGDCGQLFSVRGFNLFNTSGQAAVGGDSGGPLLLAYNGKWYIAGQNSLDALPGDSGHAAWRSLPSGWAACSALNPCQ